MAERAIRERRARRLLGKDGEALVPRERAVGLAGPRVVLEDVVIVVGEIDRRAVVERALKREREEPVPFHTGERGRGRPRIRFVVVFDVSGVHGEVERHAAHRIVDAMAVSRVVASRIFAAGDDGKRDRRRHRRGRGRAKRAFDRLAARALRIAGLDPHVVGGARLERFDLKLAGVIACRIGGHPRRGDGCATGGGSQRYPHSSGKPGERAVHLGERAPVGDLRAPVGLVHDLAECQI